MAVGTTTKTHLSESIEAIDGVIVSIRDELKDFSGEKRERILGLMDTLVQLEKNKVQNIQIISTYASTLRNGDIIFAKKLNRMYPIRYIAKRTECQFNVPKDNTQILICFHNDDENEYAEPDDKYQLVVDARDIDAILKRTLAGIPEDIY